MLKSLLVVWSPETLCRGPSWVVRSGPASLLDLLVCLSDLLVWCTGGGGGGQGCCGPVVSGPTDLPAGPTGMPAGPTGMVQWWWWCVVDRIVVVQWCLVVAAVAKAGGRWQRGIEKEEGKGD